MKDKILILIPVKTNSKRVPRKNIIPFCGIPLFIWSVIAASKSCLDGAVLYISSNNRCLTGIMLASNFYNSSKFNLDKKYLIPHQAGRPSYLSNDPYQIRHVCLHAINSSFGKTFNTLIMVQPSNPLTLPEDIVKGYELFINSKRKCVRSIVKMNKSGFKSLGFEGDSKKLVPMFHSKLRDIEERDYPQSYISNGAFVIIDIEEFRKEGTLYLDGAIGFEMPPDRSIDIDSQLDFEIAEMLLTKRLKEGEKC